MFAASPPRGLDSEPQTRQEASATRHREGGRRDGARGGRFPVHRSFPSSHAIVPPAAAIPSPQRQGPSPPPRLHRASRPLTLLARRPQWAKSQMPWRFRTILRNGHETISGADLEKAFTLVIGLYLKLRLLHPLAIGWCLLFFTLQTLTPLFDSAPSPAWAFFFGPHYLPCLTRLLIGYHR
jgi:hypothetical protein